MNITRHGQRGFGAIELIIIAAVIGLLGLLGWTWWQANYAAKTAEQTQSDQATEPKEEKLPPYVVWDYMNGDHWGALEPNPPTCANPITIQSPLNVKKATDVLYPGQVRGGDYKPHGGMGVSGSADNAADITMPMDAYLYRGARHMEQGEIQYMFDFIHPCGIMIRIGHLRELSLEFQAYAEQLPLGAEGDSRTEKFTVNKAIGKGTPIATKIGFISTKNAFFDFGMYDLRRQNEASKEPSFANEPLRRADKEQSFYAVCWLDFLPDDQMTTLRALPARGVEGKTSDYCK